MKLRPTSTAVLVLLILAIAFPPKAKAMALSDAATTVTVTTVAGAVLGASTLPFYEDSGKNTKNIFYGAAIGAVTGVLIAAYSGVQDGKVDDEEEARLNSHIKKSDSLAQSPLQYRPESSSSVQERRVIASIPKLSVPVASLHF